MYGKSAKADSGISRTYQINTELGSGGSGAVYKAWHKRLQKFVVIKTAKNDPEGTPELRRNEVEALKNIKNVHIPQVLDFLTGSDHSFTIMEYIDGISFDKLLNSGRRFTEPQIIKWYSQLAFALFSIHKQNICHRDIKPANIILTTNGDVCLIDFNSALVSGNNTGVISRSMGYASPEQYRYFQYCKNSFMDSMKVYAERIEKVLLHSDCETELVSTENITNPTGVHEIDWKLSDIYSLGATMKHLLTGKRPSVKADGVAQMPGLYGYSEGIQKIIERSTRTNPAGRYASAEELSSALRTLSPAPSSAEPTA